MLDKLLTERNTQTKLYTCCRDYSTNIKAQLFANISDKIRLYTLRTAELSLLGSTLGGPLWYTRLNTGTRKAAVLPDPEK